MNELKNQFVGTGSTKNRKVAQPNNNEQIIKCYWCQRKESQIDGYCRSCKKLFPDQEKNIEKQNTRTLMQALHGCRKNCRECREDEAEWEKEPKIIHQEVSRG